MSHQMYEPRFEEFGPLLIAGMGETYTDETSSGIPALWQRFVPHIGHIDGQVGGITYGVLMPTGAPGQFEYVCGVEVSDATKLPAGLTSHQLGKQKYAVFEHSGYLSTLRETWRLIYSKWLPTAGVRVAKAARLEIYSASFNRNKPGGLAIWIPIAD